MAHRSAPGSAASSTQPRRLGPGDTGARRGDVPRLRPRTRLLRKHQETGRLGEPLSSQNPSQASSSCRQSRERDCQDAKTEGWGGDGEIGDMCSRFPSSYIVPAGYPYAVQRLWSNSAALAGHDPCQPVPPSEAVYFNAAPVLPDLVTILSGSSRVTTSGVQIPVGETRTIEIDLFADGPVGEWNVGAADLLHREPAHLHLARRDLGDERRTGSTFRSRSRGPIHLRRRRLPNHFAARQHPRVLVRIHRDERERRGRGRRRSGARRQLH